ELVAAQEQQIATAEILQVISGSPTDLQPVFDTIARSAARLCDAFDAAIYRRDGDTLHLVAHEGPIPTASMQALVRGWTPGRAVLDGRTVHLADIQAEATEFPEGSEIARRVGNRTVLSMPLMRKDGPAIGAIMVRRTEARLFTERQVALLKTFADQAVIAIENVRLFNETKEALEQQTATSEILQVISQSPTDTQPVFEAIVERALRLSEATAGAVTSFDGELIHVVASNLAPDSPILRVFPMRPSRTGSLAARTVFERRIIHVSDALAEPGYNVSQQAAESGYRSVLSVPMMREGTVLGTITVGRSQAGPYLDRQIALLQTFADQAVIAIENVRLFKELEARTQELTRSVGELRALGGVGQALSSTL